MNTLPTLKDMTILAFAQTEIQSTGPCGIILIEKPDGEMVTAWYRLGDREWVWGHYFHPHRAIGTMEQEKVKQDAYADFLERVRSAKDIPRPVPVKVKK